MSKPEKFPLGLESVQKNEGEFKSEQLKQNDYKKQKNQGIINSDFVYIGIAFACLLGVLLFYFQGLQPLILKNYINTASQNLVEIRESFNSIIGSINNLQAEFFSEFTSIVPGQSCLEAPKYEKSVDQTERLSRISVGLLPDSRLSQIEANFKFYSSEADQIYSEFWNDYTTQLSNLNIEASGLKLMPPYLNYINSVLESCKSIEELSVYNQSVNQICDNLKTSFERYNAESEKPFFWDQVSNLNQNLLNNCQNTPRNSSTYFNWKINWLSDYEALRQFTPTFSALSEKLLGISEDFNQSFTSTIKKFDDLILFRSEFGNLWYLLKIK
jgi:hypothetical protein